MMMIVPLIDMPNLRSLHIADNQMGKLRRMACINLPNLVNFTSIGKNFVNGTTVFKDVDKLERIELLYDPVKDEENASDKRKEEIERYVMGYDEEEEETSFSGVLKEIYPFFYSPFLCAIHSFTFLPIVIVLTVRRLEEKR